MTSLASSFSSLVTLNSVNYIGHTVEAKDDTADVDQRLGYLRLFAVLGSVRRDDRRQGLVGKHGVERHRNRLRGLVGTRVCARKRRGHRDATGAAEEGAAATAVVQSGVPFGALNVFRRVLDGDRHVGPAADRNT